jgi:hypothetical protein
LFRHLSHWLQVERILQLWASGTYIVPKGPAGHFSADNWGDIKTRDGKGPTKLTRRATKWLSSLKKWDDDKWEELRAAAAVWQEEKKKRAATSSRGTSEVDEMEVIEVEDDVVVVSD